MKATATLMSVRETIMPKEDYSKVPAADKVANVLVFLTSEMSSELNGSIIPVDHGWSVI